jgi:phage-related protein
MAVQTFTPPVGPSPGTSHRPTVNLWEADFGDGYNQSTPKGINHIKRTVALKWGVLTLDQMQDITGFFERRGGNEPFYFRPFGESRARKWTCKEWDFTTEGGIWAVTATLVESFANAV